MIDIVEKVLIVVVPQECLFLGLLLLFFGIFE
jgi:hypothetical protein